MQGTQCSDDNEQCICARHELTCGKDTEKSDEEIVAMIKVLNDFVDNVITIEKKEEIGKILLWIGDFEERYEKIETLLNCKNRNMILSWCIAARVFEVRTICQRVLKKPYTNCKCNFYFLHYNRLFEFLLDNGIFNGSLLNL
jgi:hypothetical protein